VQKIIQVQNAIGKKVSHDITEIRPGEFKGTAFKKGHVVCNEDICHLQKLGKNHLYLIQLESDELHEDQAAAMLAESLAGEGIVWENNPKEGKIYLQAEVDGILLVDTVGLAAFNMIDEVMCASLHRYTMVQKGRHVAATRAIPLVVQRALIDRAVAIASKNGGLFSVRPLKLLKIGIVITGNEVFQGLVTDGFRAVLERKIERFGSVVSEVAFAPDDDVIIQQEMKSLLSSGCDMIVLTGGMSVDPDDVTRKGVQKAGATEMYYGSAVLPGAMFMMAYIGEIPVLGVPACGLHHRITILDLILPRILAGEHVTKRELAFLGHGGLCMDCPECLYPHCPFGKG